MKVAQPPGSDRCFGSVFSLSSRLRPTYPELTPGGDHAGEAKLPPAAKSLLERGLMRLDTSGQLPRLFFTEAGLAELRVMMKDRRLTDPAKFGHIQRELGIDADPGEATAQG